MIIGIRHVIYGILDRSHRQMLHVPTHNGEIAKPEPKRRAIEHRKRDMQPGSDGAVCNHSQGNEGMAKSDGREYLTPPKTNSNRSRRQLPLKLHKNML